MPQPDKKPRRIEGPFLQAVLLCERVLEEKDGSLSLVRLIDKFAVPAVVQVGDGTETVIPTAPLTGTMLVSLKSGALRGNQDVVLQLTNPEGEGATPTAYPMEFLGGELGFNLILPFNIGVSLEGLYWISVSVGGRELTRVPLTVEFQVVGRLEMGPEEDLAASSSS